LRSLFKVALVNFLVKNLRSYDGCCDENVTVKYNFVLGCFVINPCYTCARMVFVSSGRHRHYEKTLKFSAKCLIYGKLLRHTNEVSLRFLLRDALHESFFPGNLEGNIIDNHS